VNSTTACKFFELRSTATPSTPYTLPITAGVTVAAFGAGGGGNGALERRRGGSGSPCSPKIAATAPCTSAGSSYAAARSTRCLVAGLYNVANRVCSSADASARPPQRTCSSRTERPAGTAQPEPSSHAATAAVCSAVGAVSASSCAVVRCWPYDALDGSETASAKRRTSAAFCSVSAIKNVTASRCGAGRAYHGLGGASGVTTRADAPLTSSSSAPTMECIVRIGDEVVCCVRLFVARDSGGASRKRRSMNGAGRSRFGAFGPRSRANKRHHEGHYVVATRRQQAQRLPYAHGKR